ncbi:RagB/SusD family nutrient uptake outer membrane protein, partial [Mucilaginibacter sp.]|uniref:RagB/SusD family nutrient uptake outer membrane protein n=1 Tax=Mucilaginibacter sp. TaxID=1882438 RepID=UPI002609C6A6
MKQIKIVLLMVILTGLCSCRKNLLTVQPTNLLTADQIVSNDASITAYFASLYRDIPMEDFNFVKGIFYTFPDGGGRYTANWDDEALSGSNFGIGNGAGANNTIYDEIYKAIRNVNTFIQLVSATNNFPAPQQAQYIAEAKFIRAYYYYGLVKYYGGVPLVLDIPATPIPLPRNKE